MSIPKPPRSPPFSYPYRPSKIKIAPSTKTISCSSLSKTKCTTNPNCEYDQKEESCIPKSLFNGSNQYDNYESYLFKSSILWREGIRNWLQHRETICNLNDILSNIRVFSTSEKKSVSTSIIISGLIHPSSSDKKRNVRNNIIVKASPRNKLAFNNELNVEIAIYKNIISKILNNNYSPNVMAYLGFLPCRNPIVSETFQNELKEIDEYSYDLKEINFLFLEQSGGVTLADWLQDMESSTDSPSVQKDILNVMFQIVYTLTVFANLGLSHNDLHFKNIFVEKYDRPLTLFFNIENNKCIIIQTRYIPKIYDFDRSYINHPAVPRNLLLDYYCEDYGQCVKFRPKFDMFSFFMSLRQYISGFSESFQNDLIHFYDSITEMKWFESLATIDFPHLLRNEVNPTDNQFKSPNKILKLFTEEKWSVSPFIIEDSKTVASPPYVTFSLPRRMELEVKQFYPETKENYEAAPMAFFSSLPSLEEEDLFLYPEFMIPISIIWISEFDPDKSLLTKIRIRMSMLNGYSTSPNLVNINKALSYAAVYLSCSAVHRLSKDELETIFSPVFFKVISHVWNLFDNRLPILVNKYEMV